MLVAKSDDPEIVTPSEKDLTLFPVTNEWREAVRAFIDDQPRGYHADLARHCGITPGRLTETLNGRYQTSDAIPAIHEFLKWAPPMSPLASVEAGVVVYALQRMTKAQREVFEKALRAAQGEFGPKARDSLHQGLQFVLGTIQAQPKND